MIPVELAIPLICIGMTAGVEAGAALAGAWTYRAPLHRVANVLVSGAVVGVLSVLVAHWPVPLRAAMGAALGVGYELANLRWLHLWTFPNDRLLFLRGELPIALGAGLPWGLLPALAPWLAVLR